MHYYVGKDAGHVEVLPNKAAEGIEINEDEVGQFLTTDSVISRLVDRIYRIVGNDITYADRDRNAFAYISFEDGSFTLNVCGTPEDHPQCQSEPVERKDGRGKWVAVGKPEGEVLEDVLFNALEKCTECGFEVPYYDPDEACKGPEIDEWFEKFIVEFRKLIPRSQDHLLAPFISHPYPYKDSDSDIRAAIAARSDRIDALKKDFEREVEKTNRARDNLSDFVNSFHKDRPMTTLSVRGDHVEILYSWDPADLGTDVSVRLDLGFNGDSVNVSVYVEQPLEELMSMVGVPMTYENLVKAMRTNDWYLHMEAKDDHVNLLFHNYQAVYEYEEANNMSRHLVDQFARYMRDLKKILTTDVPPTPSIPGYM